jgi:hypothetical protein
MFHRVIHRFGESLLKAFVMILDFSQTRCRRRNALDQFVNVLPNNRLWVENAAIGLGLACAQLILRAPIG